MSKSTGATFSRSAPLIRQFLRSKFVVKLLCKLNALFLNLQKFIICYNYPVLSALSCVYIQGTREKTRVLISNNKISNLRFQCEVA